MPVSMYDPDGKWCPVHNVEVAAKLAAGYTLDDPAVTAADQAERQAQHEQAVKSNDELLAELMGGGSPETEETEPVEDDSKSEDDD